MPHPAEATGPTSAPASLAEPSSSSRRSGISDSKTIIPTDQKNSTHTIASSTRLVARRRTPSATTRGVCRASPKATPRRSRRLPPSGRGSWTSRAEATRWTTLSAAKTHTAVSRAWPGWPSRAAGSHQMSPPESSADAAIEPPRKVPVRESWRSTSAPGCSACTVSTNQASSGPESNARKAPVRTAATAKAANECETASAMPAATLRAAEARYTGRRPTASANPLVGSSSAKIVNPVMEARVAAWVIERPRPVWSSRMIPTMRPTGNQRVTVRM